MPPGDDQLVNTVRVEIAGRQITDPVPTCAKQLGPRFRREDHKLIAARDGELILLEPGKKPAGSNRLNRGRQESEPVAGRSALDAPRIDVDRPARNRR